MPSMEDLLQMIARTADGAYAVDPDQRIVMWNEGAEELLGYSEEEALGEDCWVLLRSEDERGYAICRPECYTLAAVAGGEPVCNFDALTRAKDGRDVWLNVSIIPLYEENDELWAIVHVFHDVDAKKRAEIFAEQVLEMAQKTRRSEPEQPAAAQPGNGHTNLTQRELEVLRLLAQGADTNSISDELHITETTVRNHVQSVLSKLGVHSRVEAVAYAFEHGLI